MAGVLFTGGLESFLDSGLTLAAWLATLKADLYQNNHTPVVTDTLADYTIATFDGYVQKTMPTWTDVGTDANNNEEFSHPDLVWTDTGSTTPNTIYGVLWRDGAGNAVGADPAPASFNMNANGLTYTYSPRFYAGQLAGSP